MSDGASGSGGRLRLVTASDCFIREEYYRSALKDSADFVSAGNAEFGPPDKADMRHLAYVIERGGPEAVEAPEALYRLAPFAEAVMVHLCPVTERFIESAPDLKLIMVNRGGTENIDLAAAARRGIPVLSNPVHNANGVVELTCGLILSQTRNIALADRLLRSGIWCESFPNSGNEYELRGLRLGIIGFGSIGRRVAELMRAFGMNTCFTDPFVPADDPDALRLGCEKVSIEELCSECDIISLHARADEVIVGRREFELMKRTAYFINTARPHLVDYDCLYEVLSTRRITGAALDVHPEEPPGASYRFLTLDNLTMTNHRGGATVNCYSDSPADMFRDAARLLHGGVPRFRVC